MAQGANKMEAFKFQMGLGHHKFDADEFALMLSNAAPDYAGDSAVSGIAEIAVGNGYPAGGLACVVHWARDGAAAKLTMDPVTMTNTAEVGSGTNIGPFQHVVLVNKTSGFIVDSIDYGAPVYVTPGNPFSITFPNGVLTDQ